MSKNISQRGYKMRICYKNGQEKSQFQCQIERGERKRAKGSPALASDSRSRSFSLLRLDSNQRPSD